MNANRQMLLGVPVDLLTMEESVEECVRLIESGSFGQHAVVNAAKVVAAHDDRLLAEAISRADLINADGMAVVWAARILGHAVPERVTGIDLMERLLAVCEDRGWSVYLLGAESEVLSRFVDVVKRRFPKLSIAGAEHGYFACSADVAGRVALARPRLLLLGMSSPRKEQFVDENRAALGPLLVMGVGGTFDVWAGKTKRAPGWMQHAGLEWLFRVMQEPRRMWKRYLIGNVRFTLLVVRELLRY